MKLIAKDKELLAGYQQKLDLSDDELLWLVIFSRRIRDFITRKVNCLLDV